MGIAGRTIEAVSQKALVKEAVRIITEVLKKGYETISVVCFSQEEADRVKPLLGAHIQQTLVDSDKAGFNRRCHGIDSAADQGA